MKIIKQGTIPTYTKQFTCNNCGTVFEAEMGEYKHCGQMAYVHDGLIYECECPVCRKKWHTLKGVKMTREDYELAHDLVRDLETLENIQYSQRAQHWVRFITADIPGMDPLEMYSTEFIDDFKEWVEAEIKKLEDKLSKL